MDALPTLPSSETTLPVKKSRSKSITDDENKNTVSKNTVSIPLLKPDGTLGAPLDQSQPEIKRFGSNRSLLAGFEWLSGVTTVLGTSNESEKDQKLQKTTKQPSMTPSRQSQQKHETSLSFEELIDSEETYRVSLTPVRLKSMEENINTANTVEIPISKKSKSPSSSKKSDNSNSKKSTNQESLVDFLRTTSPEDFAPKKADLNNLKKLTDREDIVDFLNTTGPDDFPSKLMVDKSTFAEFLKKPSKTSTTSSSVTSSGKPVSRTIQPPNNSSSNGSMKNSKSADITEIAIAMRSGETSKKILNGNSTQESNSSMESKSFINPDNITESSSSLNTSNTVSHTIPKSTSINSSLTTAMIMSEGALIVKSSTPMTKKMSFASEAPHLQPITNSSNPSLNVASSQEINNDTTSKNSTTQPTSSLSSSSSNGRIRQFQLSEPTHTNKDTAETLIFQPGQRINLGNINNPSGEMSTTASNSNNIPLSSEQYHHHHHHSSAAIPIPHGIHGPSNNSMGDIRNEAVNRRKSESNVNLPSVQTVVEPKRMRFRANTGSHLDKDINGGLPDPRQSNSDAILSEKQRTYSHSGSHTSTNNSTGKSRDDGISNTSSTNSSQTRIFEYKNGVLVAVVQVNSEGNTTEKIPVTPTVAPVVDQTVTGNVSVYNNVIPPETSAAIAASLQSRGLSRSASTTRSNNTNNNTNNTNNNNNKSTVSNDVTNVRGTEDQDKELVESKTVGSISLEKSHSSSSPSSTSNGLGSRSKSGVTPLQSRHARGSDADQDDDDNENDSPNSRSKKETLSDFLRNSTPPEPSKPVPFKQPPPKSNIKLGLVGLKKLSTPFSNKKSSDIEKSKSSEILNTAPKPKHIPLTIPLNVDPTPKGRVFSPGVKRRETSRQSTNSRESSFSSSSSSSKNPNAPQSSTLDPDSNNSNSRNGSNNEAYKKTLSLSKSNGNLNEVSEGKGSDIFKKMRARAESAGILSVSSNKSTGNFQNTEDRTETLRRSHSIGNKENKERSSLTVDTFERPVSGVIDSSEVTNIASMITLNQERNVIQSNNNSNREESSHHINITSNNNNGNNSSSESGKTMKEVKDFTNVESKEEIKTVSTELPSSTDKKTIMQTNHAQMEPTITAPSILISVHDGTQYSADSKPAPAIQAKRPQRLTLEEAKKLMQENYNELIRSKSFSRQSMANEDSTSLEKSSEMENYLDVATPTSTVFPIPSKSVSDLNSIFQSLGELDPEFAQLFAQSSTGFPHSYTSKSDVPFSLIETISLKSHESNSNLNVTKNAEELAKITPVIIQTSELNDANIHSSIPDHAIATDTIVIASSDQGIPSIENSNAQSRTDLTDVNGFKDRRVISLFTLQKDTTSTSVTSSTQIYPKGSVDLLIAAEDLDSVISGYVDTTSTTITTNSTSNTINPNNRNSSSFVSLIQVNPQVKPGLRESMIVADLMKGGIRHRSFSNATQTEFSIISSLANISVGTQTELSPVNQKERALITELLKENTELHETIEKLKIQLDKEQNALQIARQEIHLKDRDFDELARLTHRKLFEMKKQNQIMEEELKSRKEPQENHPSSSSLSRTQQW